MPGDLVANLVTCLGKKQIDHVLKMKDYFTGLEIEYVFYKQPDGQN